MIRFDPVMKIELDAGLEKLFLREVAFENKMPHDVIKNLILEYIEDRVEYRLSEKAQKEYLETAQNHDEAQQP